MAALQEMRSELGAAVMPMGFLAGVSEPAGSTEQMSNEEMLSFCN